MGRPGDRLARATTDVLGAAFGDDTALALVATAIATDATDTLFMPAPGPTPDHPDAALIAYEAELEALVVERQELDEAWPKGKTPMARWQIGRRHEECLIRIAETEPSPSPAPPCRSGGRMRCPVTRIGRRSGCLNQH